MLAPALPRPVASPAVFPGPAHTCCCYSAAWLMSPCERGPPHLVPPVGPLWALSSSSILQTISTDFVISIQVPVACYPLVGICDAVVPRCGEGNGSLLTHAGGVGKPFGLEWASWGLPPPHPAGFRDRFSVTSQPVPLQRGCLFRGVELHGGKGLVKYLHKKEPGFRKMKLAVLDLGVQVKTRQRHSGLSRLWRRWRLYKK